MPIESCQEFQSKPTTPVWGIGAPRDADRTPAVCCAFLPYRREEQMPAQRFSMRQVREVLRLKWACGLSDRKMAHS